MLERAGGRAAGTGRGPRNGIASVVSDLPPHAYFVVSAIFHYLGPAWAVLLFVRVDVLGVAWLRIASAALVFALWRRPWRVWHHLDRDTRIVLVTWGAVLAIMNSAFYLAIDRLPLATVAAIEFLPVIVLAAVALRTRRNLLALVLAAVGVALTSQVQFSGGGLGLLFAALNAILFAAYVVLGHRASRNGRIQGIDALGLAMMIAAVVALPIGVADAAPALVDPVALAAGVGIGVCSSVVPYVADQLAMARLQRGTYALMVCLLPATATVIGIVVLAQVPSVMEVAAILLVVAGVALHREYAEPEHPAGPTPTTCVERVARTRTERREVIT